jgi:signal peptidase II
MGVVRSEQSTESIAEPPPAQGETTLPPRRVGLLIVVAVLALAVDVLSKVLVVAKLEGHPPLKLAGGALYLVVFRNSGAAFSMATGMTWVLSLIALGVVTAIIWTAPRLRSAGWAVGLGLVLAGALGNLADRIFRTPGPLRGHVVDFLSLFSPDGHVWPVFNAADSAICVGGALIVLMALLGKDFDGGVGRMTAKKEAA